MYVDVCLIACASSKLIVKVGGNGEQLGEVIEVLLIQNEMTLHKN